MAPSNITFCVDTAEDTEDKTDGNIKVRVRNNNVVRSCAKLNILSDFSCLIANVF